MSILNLISHNNKAASSVKILPPINGTDIEKVCQTIDTLRKYNPQYINRTTHRSEYVYTNLGNGLYKRNRLRHHPLTLATAIVNKYSNIVATPILCNGFTHEDTENYLRDLQFLSITDLLLLRGAKAQHQNPFVSKEDGHSHAIELQKQTNKSNQEIFVEGSQMNITSAPFSYGVVCYPEKHEETPHIVTDIAQLRKGQDMGVEYAVSQLFFDTNKFITLLNEVKKTGFDRLVFGGIKSLKKNLN